MLAISFTSYVLLVLVALGILLCARPRRPLLASLSPFFLSPSFRHCIAHAIALLHATWSRFRACLSSTYVDSLPGLLVPSGPQTHSSVLGIGCVECGKIHRWLGWSRLLMLSEGCRLAGQGCAAHWYAQVQQHHQQVQYQQVPQQPGVMQSLSVQARSGACCRRGV